MNDNTHIGTPNATESDDKEAEQVVGHTVIPDSVHSRAQETRPGKPARAGSSIVLKEAILSLRSLQSAEMNVKIRSNAISPQLAEVL